MSLLGLLLTAAALGIKNFAKKLLDEMTAARKSIEELNQKMSVTITNQEWQEKGLDEVKLQLRDVDSRVKTLETLRIRESHL